MLAEERIGNRYGRLVAIGVVRHKKNGLTTPPRKVGRNGESRAAS